jgi:hypothetical protein
LYSPKPCPSGVVEPIIQPGANSTFDVFSLHNRHRMFGIPETWRGTDPDLPELGCARTAIGR